MFHHLSIHHPKPGQREALVESRHRFGAALAGAPGFISVPALYDADEDVLVGLAVWESEEAFRASVGLARAAFESDPFDDWEAEDVTGYRLTEV